MTERIVMIAGNWKMNGLLGDAETLVSGIAEGLTMNGVEVVVCPPFVAIERVVATVANSAIKVGGQTCHAAEKGAHTGDVSAVMLGDAGCSHVILGHSERRTDHGETDPDVAAKVSAAWAAGLTAIVCVGETEAERDAGATNEVVGGQVAGSIPDGATVANLVVAYEPVWAIGTGRTPTVAEAGDVHRHIRGCLAARFGTDVASGVRILYGGSMKPDNASDFLADPDIDGGLIGGASLKPDDFLAIIDAAI